MSNEGIFLTFKNTIQITQLILIEDVVPTFNTTLGGYFGLCLSNLNWVCYQQELRCLTYFLTSPPVPYNAFDVNFKHLKDFVHPYSQLIP